MRFVAEHRFPAPRDAVAEVLADAGFYQSLELPDLRLIEVQAEDPAADAPAPSADVVLRYEFMGNLDPMAQRLLGGARPTWVQEVHLDGSAGGRLVFAAESKPSLLHGSASFALEEACAGTLRRLDGELVVAVPVLGAMAERRIVPGVLTRLDVEAEAVRRRLAPG